MRTKILIVALFVVSLLAAGTVGSAIAAPVGGCPDGFHLHSLADHHHSGEGGDHPHKHVGNDKDLNGDGYICGKHVGKDGSVHVHIDNNVPLD